MPSLPSSRLMQLSTPLMRLPFLFSFVLALLLATLTPHGHAQTFGFNDVAKRAKALANAPYRKPQSPLPEELQNLSYDQYRNIRFKQERAHWADAKLPFELAFFHMGHYYDLPVRIYEVSRQGAREMRYTPDDFSFGNLKVDPSKLRGLSYAGFRVHYPINTPQYKDEVLVMLGASYFRAVGKGQQYGLSARGLGIDTALNSGEEFPRFTEFWIERPAAQAKELVIYALLDSRRATGAYRFVLRPGVDTVMDVKAQLYLRENVSKLGIAPLTSMFFFGDNQRSETADYRPEAHDSDGLSIQSGTGEWIWRPLSNPRRLLVTSYALSNPQGFGLMQRDRQFANYEDLEFRYELRPSGWIEPKGNWGTGRVELVQIPTPDETNDNVVAYWVPDNPPKPGRPYDLEYRILWQKDNEKRPPLAWVTQTRRGQGMTNNKPDDTIMLVVDFDGSALKKLPVDAPMPTSSISADANAQIVDNRTLRNDATGGWRMMLRLRRIDPNKPIELRGFLRSGNNTLSETWSYILPPG